MAMRSIPGEPAPDPMDEFLESWVCWREACEDVRSAYTYWGTCAMPQRCIAFANYRAALDREEHAARRHSIWTDRIRAGTGATTR